MNLGFTFVFLFEMAAKLLALGCSQYWNDRWNCFDGKQDEAYASTTSTCEIGFWLNLVSAGIVTLTSLLDVVALLLASTVHINTSMFRAIRFLRVFRLLRMLKFFKGVEKLVTTFVMSLPSLANITMLMLLVIFIYAGIGVQLFHKVFLSVLGSGIVLPVLLSPVP